MRKIFIDCGANVGQTIDFFKKYEKNYKEFEMYSFEGNTNLIDRITTRHKDLIDSGNLTVHNKAVWIENTNIKFYISVGGDGATKLGSSLDVTKNNVKENVFIDVEAIDLHKWITTEFSKDDYIFLKMDIEGSEYDVVPHLLKNGTFEYIDKFVLDSHQHKVDLTRLGGDNLGRSSEKNKKIDNDMRQEIKDNYNVDLSEWIVPH